MITCFCPNCLGITECTERNEQRDIKIKGQIINAEFKYLECNECNQKFEPASSDYDPLENAYREYKSSFGLLQKEEIIKFRKGLDLNQRQMARLLGIGVATLNRFENGALQSDSLDKTIRYYMIKENLISRIEELKTFSNSEPFEVILERLKCMRANDTGCSSYPSLYEDDIKTEFNGFTSFDFDKLRNTILFFCSKTSVYKTKLNKLLFYSDFLHYKVYGRSITGAYYAKATHGPVLNGLESFLDILKNDFTSRSVDFGDYTGVNYSSRDFDRSVFSDVEFETLLWVNDYFMNFTAKRISEYSHDEKAFQVTAVANAISYKYANDLQLSIQIGYDKS